MLVFNMSGLCNIRNAIRENQRIFFPSPLSDEDSVVMSCVFRRDKEEPQLVMVVMEQSKIVYFPSFHTFFSLASCTIFLLYLNTFLNFFYLFFTFSPNIPLFAYNDIEWGGKTTMLPYLRYLHDKKNPTRQKNNSKDVVDCLLLLLLLCCVPLFCRRIHSWVIN